MMKDWVTYSMKVALISDIHFGSPKKYFDEFLDSQVEFFKNQFIPYLKANNIEKIFFLGDFFDNRNSINIKAKNYVVDLFENYLTDFDITMILGNHDIYYTDTTKIHSLKFLEKYPNVEIIENVKSITIDDRKLLLCPWVINEEEFIKTVSKQSFDVCLGHFSITGFNFDKYRINKAGMSSEVFQKCKKVFTGHFHIRSKKKIGDSEIFYIGAPFQFIKSDTNEERGFAVLDLNDLSHEYVNNTKSIKFIEVTYPERITKKRINGNSINIVIDYNKDIDEDDLEKYIREIEKNNPICTPKIEIINKNAQTIDKELEITNTIELMHEYIKILEIDNKKEISDRLIGLYNDVKGE